MVMVSTGGIGFPADRTIALGFGGSATKGTDYSVDAESLTLTAGQTLVSTTVRAVDDEVMDPDETIDITGDPGRGGNRHDADGDDRRQRDGGDAGGAVGGAGNGCGGCRRDGRER